MEFLSVNGVLVPVEMGSASMNNGREAPATSVAGALLYTRKAPLYELSFSTTLISPAEQAEFTRLFSFPVAKELEVAGSLNGAFRNIFEGRILETKYVTALWRVMKLELRSARR